MSLLFEHCCYIRIAKLQRRGLLSFSFVFQVVFDLVTRMIKRRLIRIELLCSPPCTSLFWRMKNCEIARNYLFFEKKVAQHFKTLKSSDFYQTWNSVWHLPSKHLYYAFFVTGQVFSQNLRNRLDLSSSREGPKTADNNYLGYSLAIGDFTGSGRADLAVGMPRSANLTGKVKSWLVFPKSNVFEVKRWSCY